MIAYLTGELLQVQERFCTLLTAGGIGYKVAVPRHTMGEMPAPGEKVALHTSLVVREDAMELYGFATPQERDTFEILTAISRVGSRTALAILSVFRPEDLEQLVSSGDPRSLAQVPGIGAKMAQHIFLELKYKLRNIPQAQPAAASLPASVSGDAIAALCGLGYQQEECSPIVRKLLAEEPDLDAGDVIRQALKRLAKGK